jgi:predicted RNA-binding Zn-ribbon protein involved in translation (DUF1610 family)
MPSPIEMMIDRATGYDPSAPPPKHLVRLECPDCRSSKLVSRHRTDPKKATAVICRCPKCGPAGEVEYRY